MKSNLLTRGALIAAVSGLALTMTACGSDDSSDTASTSSADGGSSSAAATTAESSAAEAAPENFGAGCAAVPTDGAGSFADMAQAPVATAASTNPVLTTLVAAVTAAGLGDTLNSAPDITVLAPYDGAFSAIPSDSLNAVIADVPTLTTILTHHVIDGRLTPEELAGTHTTLAGDEVTIEGSGEDFSIAAADTILGTSPATVICGNVQTANATVYIIDQVLKPAAA